MLKTIETTAIVQI
uniref:Uncharacterized protein n=1 Tax=Anguilla anguilla TaxID=7936 RepID=A0A0E9QRK2_ANGAN